VLGVLDQQGLKNAAEIVLSGDSAGGIGTWPHLDWLQQRYPGARVVGVPIAAFHFFAVPYTGPGHTSSNLADFRESAWAGHVALWDSFVNTACAAAIEPWRCMLANYSFPYVKSSVFVVESLTDKVTEAQDWVPDWSGGEGVFQRLGK
jgi:hypothetical protein